jgi:hypothetical protein
LGHSFGSGNPHRFELLEKETGSVLLQGVYVDSHEEAEILLYIVDNYPADSELIVYDNIYSKHHTIDVLKGCDCQSPSVGPLTFCLDISSVNNNEIVLKCVWYDKTITVAR